MKIDRKLGKKPRNTNTGAIFFFKFQLIAPIKTNIINEQKKEKSFNILVSKYFKKNLSNRMIKKGRRPKQEIKNCKFILLNIYEYRKPY